MGVVIFRSIIYLRAIIRYIACKFASTSLYSPWDVDVHTDRREYIVDVEQEYTLWVSGMNRDFYWIVHKLVLYNKTKWRKPPSIHTFHISEQSLYSMWVQTHKTEFKSRQIIRSIVYSKQQKLQTMSRWYNNNNKYSEYNNCYKAVQVKPVHLNIASTKRKVTI